MDMGQLLHKIQVNHAADLGDGTGTDTKSPELDRPDNVPGQPCRRQSLNLDQVKS
jgi:hypothetical protein